MGDVAEFIALRLRLRPGRLLLLVAATVAAACGMGCHPGGPPKLRLWQLAAELHQYRFVDLTHAFDEQSPHWLGFEPMVTRDIYGYQRDGFWAQVYTHVGQWGTHVDPPAHFHERLRTVSDIPVNEMILPLVVIDVHDKVATNPDYVLTLADIKEWEAIHGPIPEGAFVAMRTDWAKRWPSNETMHNRDRAEVAHYPGWTLEALKYLYEIRRITASGHETTDTDPGVSTSRGIYQCESYILGQDHYQIELLTNLDQVPEAGAMAVVTFPKPARGSGFPARVFAIVPTERGLTP